jgi:ribose-phosphate pyrophosphokinase
MRGTLIFAGSSCPDITDKICHNLGMARADAELTQFSNGETSVRILTSVREKDVFVVQSGSPKINDTIMELLIMISACKGGSANKITGTSRSMPQFAGTFRRWVQRLTGTSFSCAAVLPVQPPIQEKVA